MPSSLSPLFSHGLLRKASATLQVCSDQALTSPLTSSRLCSLLRSVSPAHSWLPAFALSPGPGLNSAPSLWSRQRFPVLRPPKITMVFPVLRLFILICVRIVGTWRVRPSVSDVMKLSLKFQKWQAEKVSLLLFTISFISQLE